jgi:thymidylate kinase
MFLVLEGIDGAGKGRQRLELVKLMEEKGINIDGTEFPDHQGVLYKYLIKPYLLEELKLSPEALFVSFSLDQLLFQQRIRASLGSKTNYFLCDGYFTTNLVYQCLVNDFVKIEIALEFARQFNIVPADHNIFIDVDPKVALERKSQEAGHEKGLDINERDLSKQYKIRQGFLYLAKHNIFGNWSIVDGNGDIASVSKGILSALKKAKIDFN